MVNSRAKGCRGEREAAAYLNETFGTESRRGQQYKGTPDSPDIANFIPGLHPEIKRVEKLNINEAIQKAVEDAGDQIGFVMHRKNRCGWLFTVRGEDLFNFCKAIVDCLENKKPQ